MIDLWKDFIICGKGLLFWDNNCKKIIKSFQATPRKPPSCLQPNFSQIIKSFHKTHQKTSNKPSFFHIAQEIQLKKSFHFNLFLSSRVELFLRLFLHSFPKIHLENTSKKHPSPTTLATSSLTSLLLFLRVSKSYSIISSKQLHHPYSIILLKPLIAIVCGIFVCVFSCIFSIV